MLVDTWPAEVLDLVRATDCHLAALKTARAELALATQKEAALYDTYAASYRKMMKAKEAYIGTLRGVGDD